MIRWAETGGTWRVRSNDLTYTTGEEQQMKRLARENGRLSAAAVDSISRLKQTGYRSLAEDGDICTLPLPYFDIKTIDFN